MFFAIYVGKYSSLKYNHGNNLSDITYSSKMLCKMDKKTIVFTTSDKIQSLQAATQTWKLFTDYYNVMFRKNKSMMSQQWSLYQTPLKIYIKWPFLSTLFK